MLALYETVAEPLDAERVNAVAAAPTTSPSPRPRPCATCSTPPAARCRAPNALASIGPVTSADAARARPRARPRGRPAHPRRTRRTRSSPTRAAWQMPRPITFLSDYGLADEFVGVVPRRDRAHRARRAGSSTSPTGSRASPCSPGALMLARALPYAPPGVHLAVVDPEVGARRRAVALRTAATTACSSAPTTACCPRRRALRRGRRGGRDLDARRGGSSPSRPRSTAATCSPPSPPGWRRASRWPRPATPLDPDELVRPRAAAAAPRRGRAARRARDGVDGFGNVHARRRATSDLPRPACARPRGRDRRRRPQRPLRARPSPTSRRASCCSTRTPAATLALAVNRG